VSGLAGQAARTTGRVCKALAQLAFALVLAVCVLLGALGWRLARGPLEMPWLARLMVQTVNAGQPMHVAIGGAALAWEGFSGGVDEPIDIQVRDIVLTDKAGTRIASIPRAAVSLSPRRLVFGEIAPRAVEVDGLRLTVERDITGAVTLDVGGKPVGADAGTSTAAAPGAKPGAKPGDAVADLLRQFVRPASNDQTLGAGSRLSQLSHVRLSDAAVTVVDRQLGATWSLRALTVDLARQGEGGLSGVADGTLWLGQDISAPLRVTADLDRTSGRTDVTASLGNVVPASLARVVPAWNALAPFAMPASLRATVQLAPDLTPGDLSAQIALAAGPLRLPGAEIAVLGGALSLQGNLRHATIDVTRLAVAPRADGRPTQIQAKAEVTRAEAGDVTVGGTLDVDAVAFADLPALWPAGMGGPGARKWVTENITDGVASHGHVDVGVHIPADFSDVQVTRLAGGIEGTGLTVSWLSPVPPVVHAAAKLSLTGPDALAITVTDGVQSGGRDGGLRVQAAHIKITGLSGHDQFADIDADVAGTVPDLLTLLRSPRLHLLDRSPLPINDASGQIAGRIGVAHLPLRDGVTMDDVAIRATAKATALRLPAVAAGHDVEQGTATIDVTNAGLHAAGTASVEGIAEQVQLDLDFRNGPKTQIVQKVTATGTADARQLAALGLQTADLLAGRIGLAGTLTVQRSGEAEARVDADLRPAVLTVAPLGYTKPAGQAARLTATVRMAPGNQVTEIAPIRLFGEGIRLDAILGFAKGRPDLLTLRQAVIGGNTDVAGTVRIPRAPGDPWQVQIGGRSLDLSSQFEHNPKSREPSQEPAPAGPAYIADVRLERAVLTKGRPVVGVVAHIEDDGRVIRRLSVSGRTTQTGGGVRGGGGPFTVAITPQDAVRKLAASTDDAGAMLLALDIDDKIEGGRMKIDGTYDDTRSDRPLVGTAIVEDFRVHNAPFLAKLLQAMTLYGLVEVAQGPGLGFSRLEAPFRDDGAVLQLSNARAFNASLGMTVQGAVDLTTRVADLDGTIVPAYFFNSLLGDIPLLGKLFSPEKGGGLFAATYSVRGSLDDPSVSVNPLAALTPGFLRGVFGIFDKASTPGAPSPVTTTAPDRR
jgi:hypothetical protein